MNLANRYNLVHISIAPDGSKQTPQARRELRRQGKTFDVCSFCNMQAPHGEKPVLDTNGYKHKWAEYYNLPRHPWQGAKNAWTK